MVIEQTLSIIKPDATARKLTRPINVMIRKAGLRIVAQKRVRWTLKVAEEFYSEHKDRPFFRDLCAFMTSGPIVVQVVEGENAIARYRELMGSTDPNEAKEGTIRKLYALSKSRNSVHGSDSVRSARREIALNFPQEEVARGDFRLSA